MPGEGPTSVFRQADGSRLVRIALALGLLSLPAGLAADYTLLDNALAYWLEPGMLTTIQGPLLLSAAPVDDWPSDLVVRRASQLAAAAPGRLAILVPHTDPRSVAQLRAAVPAVSVVEPFMLTPPPETFADLRQWAETPQGITLSGTRTVGQATLTISSRRVRDTDLEVTALQPAGLLGDGSLVVRLPARGTLTVPVQTGGACGEWLLRVSEVGRTVNGPLLVEPVDNGLRAGFRAGRQMTRDAASLPVELSAVGQRFSGQLRSGVGLPFEPLNLSPGRTVRVDVPMLPAGPGWQRREVTAELVSGTVRRSLRASAVSVPAAAVERRAVRLDQRLDEWRDAAWQTVEQAGQVVTGAAAWHGPADAGVRWSVARDASALYLAAVITDDQAALGDALELRWDAALGADGEPGLMTRSTTFGRAAASGELATGWWLEARMAMAVPGAEAGGMIGWDLVYHDADPDDGDSVLAASGERWSSVDPARLGLLSWLPVRGLTRWWVTPQDCDGGAMGN